MTRQCVLDTETTGIAVASGHRVIEIGVVEIIDRKITGNTFHVYLNPERIVDDGAIRVHGLTNEFLANKPKYIDVHKDFLAFIKDSELIAHNASFDVGFIEQEWSYLGFEQKVNDFCKVTDTLMLARKKYPGQKNSLDVLCKRLGVDLSKRVSHGALLDAELLSSVYLLMTSSQKEIKLQAELLHNGSLDTVQRVFPFEATKKDLEEHCKIEKLIFE